MSNYVTTKQPTRFLVSQNIFNLVNVLARAIRVQDWTDLGSGDGASVAAATKGLSLARRTAVRLGFEVPPALNGWKIHNSEVKQWVESLPIGAGDCVSMFDVIEHFERDKAESLLQKLEDVFRVVVIFTPRGFLQQDASTDPSLRDDPLMWHRCGFNEPDFAARGYLTFFWPVFHFPLGQCPHGAVLAIRVSNATENDLETLRALVVREHRRSLLTTPAFRLFLTRLAVWKIAGTEGIRFLSERGTAAEQRS